MIGSINELSSQDFNQQAGRAGAAGLGRDDFLMLLIEQLKAQDPFNAQDASEFTAQLAQFSQLEELFKLGDALNGLTLLSASLNNTSAAGFLGREVLALGETIGLKDGQASGIHFDLGADAAKVTIKIYDSEGNLVRTEELDNQSAGEGDYQWDGNMDSGEAAPDGIYKFSVEATDADDQTIFVKTLISGKVTGIAYDNGLTLLEMDGQRIPIADVQSVRLLES